MFQSPERRNTDSLKWGLFDEDVLPLWVADMDFTSPPVVIEALQRRVAHGVFGYALDSRELKELVVARMELLHGWKITPDDILLVPGVVSGFNLVCQAVTRAGESILLQPPVYPPFFEVPVKAEARAVYNNILPGSDGQYRVDLGAFDHAIEKDTKAFLLCNPHNPLGRVFTRDELLGMAESCLRRKMVIIADEIHCDLIFSGYQHIPIASLDQEVAASTVTLIAPSKTFNIAGLDCSILICQDRELRERIKQAKRGLMGGVNLLGMAAAVAAYRDGASWLAEVIAYLETNRDHLMTYLEEKLPRIHMVKPEATYLAWLDCRELNLPISPREHFYRNARVALNDGSDFGEPGRGFVRLNFGCSREILDKALESMSSSLT